MLYFSWLRFRGTISKILTLRISTAVAGNDWQRSIHSARQWSKGSRPVTASFPPVMASFLLVMANVLPGLANLRPVTGHQQMATGFLLEMAKDFRPKRILYPLS